MKKIIKCSRQINLIYFSQKFEILVENREIWQITSNWLIKNWFFSVLFFTLILVLISISISHYIPIKKVFWTDYIIA